MSNTVEYCRIVCILGHFWAIFTCFLHYSTLTNKNTNNYSFWFDFYDLNQIIIRFDSSVFDIIRLFIANHVELFASFRFVSLRFTIRITSFLTRFDLSQDTKLGRIIRLKNIIRKYSVFVSLFGTRIGSKQASLFVSYKKQIPFLKSNNVEYCRILSNSVHFGTFLSHFYMLFALFDFNK